MREYDTDAIVTGEDTYKPKLVGINDVPLAALAAAFALTTALAAALATALFTTTAVAPPPTTLTPHAPPPPPLPPTHRHRHRLHQPHHHHQVPGQFAGCCYHDKTHQCPCFDTVQAEPAWVRVRGRVRGSRAHMVKRIPGLTLTLALAPLNPTPTAFAYAGRLSREVLADPRQRLAVEPDVQRGQGRDGRCTVAPVVPLLRTGRPHGDEL